VAVRSRNRPVQAEDPTDMRIEATREDIRVLVELIELDDRAGQVVAESETRARDAAERRLPDALLTRYRWLKATGRYPAMAAVEQETCSGCHVRLATMIADLVKRSIGIYTCPGCRRMLYAPELRAERPAEGGAAGKAGSRRSPRQVSAHHS
jgi:predicted  nucleic acid-binding Zn-ribbon protein